MRIRLLLFILVSFQAVQALEAEVEDPWEPLRFMLGSWEGREKGAPGIGEGTRSYEFVMRDTFLFAKNKSVFKPQEKNPEGETHLDWAIFSYDKGRECLVLREFHVEGYVITYANQPDPRKKVLVFVSDHVENGPAGLQARVIYRVVGKDEFHETFELAMPGKDFTVLLENKWLRKL